MHKDQLQNTMFFELHGKHFFLSVSVHAFLKIVNYICTQFSLRQLLIVMTFPLCPGHDGIPSTPSFLEATSHTTQSKLYKTKAFLLIYGFVIRGCHSNCRHSLGISWKKKIKCNQNKMQSHNSGACPEST